MFEQTLALPKSSFFTVYLRTFAWLVWLTAVANGLAIVVGHVLATSADIPFWLADLALVVVNLSVVAVGAQTFLNRLSQLEATLTALNDGKHVQPLELCRSQPLEPLIVQLNAIIAERASFQSMRGTLVEQISETAAQEERNRLARDLHDSIKQQIFSISVAATAAQARLTTDVEGARLAMQDVKQSAQEAMVEMRAMLQQLSPAPLEKAGLIDALREQAEAFSYRTGANIQLRHGDLPDNAQFPLGAQEAVFRITQEALSNIARHARARNATIEINMPDTTHICLSITDDGQGFDPLQIHAGMGLGNIRARALALGATMALHSQPGHGTRIEVPIPLLMELRSVDDARYPIQKAALDHYVNWYRYLIASICVLLFALPLVATGTARLSEPDDPGTIYRVLTAGFGVTVLGAIATIVFTSLKTRQAHSAFRVVASDRDAIMYKMRRFQYVGNCAIALVALWFLPLIWITDGVASIAPLLISAVMGVFLAWSYLQASRMCTAEFQFVAPAARLIEIEKYQATIRSSWWSVGFLFLVLLLTGTFRNGIQWMPSSQDGWMTSAMVIIALLMLANQVIQILYYREHHRIATKELV